MPPTDPRAQEYKDYLGGAKERFNERVKNCSCPTDFPENYEYLKELGGGGFGTVYEARRKSTDEMRALKVMNKVALVQKRSSGNTDFAKMIIKEKEYQWAMESPFTVKLEAAFKDPTYVYLAMEFGLFGSLSNHIEEDSELTHDSLRLIAGMIVLGLEYLHSCGILYRDLKPDNIMVFDDGYVKLGDFGISTVHEGYASNALGTLEYCAPETSQGIQQVDGVDWWAFGVVLYEMYSKGAWVFGDNDEDVLDAAIWLAILEDPPQFRHASVPEEVRNIVERLLVKDVTRRLGATNDGARDVKNHPYFEGLNFYDLYDKRIPMDPDEFLVINFDPVAPGFKPAQGDGKDIYKWRFSKF